MASELHLKASRKLSVGWKRSAGSKRTIGCLFNGCWSTDTCILLTVSYFDVCFFTYFLELFLRRVRGESSAALMTLVLEDIRRNVRTLFSAAPPFISSFSSILVDATFNSRLHRELFMAEQSKGNVETKENWPGVYKESRGSMTTARTPRRKFEYGGLLEIDQSEEAAALRHRDDRRWNKKWIWTSFFSNYAFTNWYLGHAFLTHMARLHMLTLLAKT